jgi:hypothetical protein
MHMNIIEGHPRSRMWLMVVALGVLAADDRGRRSDSRCTGRCQFSLGVPDGDDDHGGRPGG